jgi:hypothetical protein
MQTDRLEAFSDGVIAILITIMRPPFLCRRHPVGIREPVRRAHHVRGRGAYLAHS